MVKADLRLLAWGFKNNIYPGSKFRDNLQWLVKILHTNFNLLSCSTLICNHVRQACSAHVCCVAYPFAEIRNTELSSTYQERWSWIPNQKIKRKKLHLLPRSTKAMCVPLKYCQTLFTSFYKDSEDTTRPGKRSEPFLEQELRAKILLPACDPQFQGSLI